MTTVSKFKGSEFVMQEHSSVKARQNKMQSTVGHNL